MSIDTAGRVADAEPEERATIRVLLADDHAILRQGVRLLLEGEGDLQVVGEASTGEEALQETLRLKPDVAVVDIALPDQSGIRVTQEIRRQAASVRVLILTMYDREDYLVEALAAGASGYVVKESAVEQLVQAVRAVARGHYVLFPDRSLELVGRLSRRDTAGRGPLTRREEEILRLIVQGLHNPEIARRLSLSVKTVQTHRSHIMEKLDAHDRIDLVKYALRHGMCDP